MVLGSVKFGFVATYLSEPLVRAYTTAAAAHAVVAQLKYILGVSPTRFSGPFSLAYVSTVKYLVLNTVLICHSTANLGANNGKTLKVTH